MPNDTQVDEPKRVTIFIADRDSSDTFTRTVMFTDFDALRQEVSQAVNDTEWRKVSVELEASWDTTAEEQAALEDVELG